MFITTGYLPIAFCIIVIQVDASAADTSPSIIVLVPFGPAPVTATP